jgi:hypothetical protein
MIAHYETGKIPERAPGALESANDVLRFIFGGNATFTLRSAKTGARFTYKIRQPGIGKPFFASVLSGQNNETDFDYVGFIPAATRDVLVAGNKGKPDAPSFKALAWTVYQLATKARIPEHLEVFHEGRCCACGRKLTTPESILSGIGPECAKKPH